MKTRRVLQMLLLLSGICGANAFSTSLAAQQPARQNVFADDARMQKHIALNVEGLPLTELLDLLSKQTGVTLTAGKDIADEKVIAFQKSRRLQDTLSDIAALYDAVWTPVEEKAEAKEARKRYILALSRRAEELEARLTRQTAANTLNQLETYVRVANGFVVKSSVPDAEELQHRFAAFPITRSAVQLYGSLDTEQQDLLLARRLLNLPYKTLSPQQQSLARSLFDEAMRTNPSLRDRLARYQDTPANMLEHNGVLFRVRGSAGGMLTLGVEVGGAYRGAYCETATITGRSQWLLPPHGDPYAEKPIGAGDTLPSEKSIRDAARMEEEWRDKLRAIATATGTPIFSDFYHSKSIAIPLDDPFPQTSARTDVQALDALCKPESYLWWTRGPSVLLRKRNWYVQHLYEVSDRWIVSLSRQMDKRKTPIYADVLRLGDLSGTQIAGLNLNYGSDAGANNIEADTANFFGLPELLALMQERAAPKGNTTELPTSPPTRAQTLTYDDMTAEQRKLLPNFIVAQEEPFALQDSGANGIKIWCFYQLPSQPVKTAYHIMVGYSLSSAFRPFNLSLPAGLTDDRRDRTKIEVMP